MSETRLGPTADAAPPTPDHPARVRATLAAQPSAAWCVLGRAGLLEPLYHGTPRRIRRDRLAGLLTELDAARPVGQTLSVCVQAATVVPLLDEMAAHSPVAAAIRDAALAGHATVALAATDAGPGSDLAALDCRLTIEGADVILDGRKRWITNATVADHLLVLARHRPGRHFTSFTWVLVPATAPGVRVDPADTPLFTGAGLGEVEFTDVRLPAAHVVGRRGHGLAAFARHIATERLAGALWGVALCRRVVAATAERLAHRVVVDQPLVRHPVVRQSLARAVVRTRQLAALCDDLGPRVTNGPDAGAAAALKVAVADTTREVLDLCGQLQGADGFGPAGTQLTRAEAAVFGIGGGTTELVLDVVADHLDPLLNGAAA
ncbi:acyl-CoA dehydrogenase [Micromonospora sp. NPDC047074]|uniref:acyl-CoA dehydrogenase family protein n=1 Tax=Micromonospora sp. NPDC047074 TaxID=3154339 RepID=UPI0033CDCB59